MTDLAELRDQFAGQALAGAIAHRGADNIDEDTAAAWSYRMADAMLAARDIDRRNNEAEPTERPIPLPCECGKPYGTYCESIACPGIPF